MRNPWENNDKAFAPMFTESVQITGKRDTLTTNETLECVIFSDTTGDPFSSEAVSTDREDISISVSPNDWGYLQKIKRGDTIFRPWNGKKYKVSEVKNDIAIGWTIKAREV